MSVSVCDCSSEFERYRAVIRANGCSIGTFEWNDSVLMPIQRRTLFGNYKTALLPVAYLVMSPGRIVFNGLDRRGEGLISKIANEISTTYSTNVVIYW